MIERDKEYYNQKISELYSIIENQEKIIRDLQENIILLKASEPMLELTKEYGEKDLYKQRIDKALKHTHEILGFLENCVGGNEQEIQNCIKIFNKYLEILKGEK